MSEFEDSADGVNQRLNYLFDPPEAVKERFFSLQTEPEVLWTRKKVY